MGRKREMASFELAEKGGIFGGGFRKCRGWIVKDGKFGGGWVTFGLDVFPILPIRVRCCV